MGLIKPMSENVSHMKALFRGKQGSGKTYTATELACGIHKFFKIETPVLCIDTEGGFRFRRSYIHDQTGIAPVGVETRKFDDLMESVNEAEELKIEVILIDSITHFWQGLMEARKAGVAQKTGKSIGNVTLTLNDIGAVIDRWEPFARWLVCCKKHVIVCGRLGYEWGDVEDDRGNSKLTKIGTKTKAQSEFGHEPDFVFEMSQIQRDHPEFHKAIDAGVVGDDIDSVSKVSVIKDRWGLLMGHKCYNPTYDFFAPIVNQFRDRPEAIVDAEPGIENLTDTGLEAWKFDKKAVLENIENSIVRVFPSTGVADKQSKLDIMHATFGSLSWTYVRSLPLPTLKEIKTKLMFEMDAIRNGGRTDVAIKNLKEFSAMMFGDAVDPESLKDQPTKGELQSDEVF